MLICTQPQNGVPDLALFMINLKDFYSQQQVMALLGMKYRMQVKRWREDCAVPHIDICKKPYYFRTDVDNYLAQLVKSGQLNPFDIEIKKLKQVTYDISLDEYLPRCMALKLIKLGKTSLYNKSEKHIFGLIKHRKAYGFMWFLKTDLIDFLVEELSISEIAAKRHINTVAATIPRLPARFFKIDKK